MNKPSKKFNGETIDIEIQLICRVCKRDDRHFTGQLAFEGKLINLRPLSKRKITGLQANEGGFIEVQ